MSEVLFFVFNFPFLYISLCLSFPFLFLSPSPSRSVMFSSSIFQFLSRCDLTSSPGPLEKVEVIEGCGHKRSLHN